ncbi:MAG: hypothetical protein KC588_13715 [Nitrospira sp.]|nr:hypothetical protein [Nitrospira sp.]
MRHPVVKFIGEERYWYSDAEENVLGVVVFDRCDEDWLYVILGRDERARFRAIDQEINFNTDTEARNALHKKIVEYSQAGKNVFSQGLERKFQKTFLIFKPLVARNRLHPDFLILLESSGYSPARQIITEIAYTFKDPDGNYIQQFQSNGFDARLWELYLYATLHELDFDIDRTYKAPDYVCSKFDKKVIVEATTVNSPWQKEATTLEMLKTKELEDFVVIKFGSALYSKMKKRYWERDHVKGHSFVIAVADLRRPEKLSFCAPLLMQYLYGMQQQEELDRITYCQIKEHVWGKKKIPSGFFNQPDSENVSAILFSDSGTIAKFNRMGKVAEFGDPSVIMARVGERYDMPQSAAPTPFRSIVEPGKYNEAWAEGIWIFHNPKAKIPIDKELFPNVAHVCLENGEFMIYLADAFPTWSKTLIFSSEAEADKFRATVFR